MTSRPRAWIVGAVGALALLLAGCGTATTPTSVAPPPNLKELTLVGAVQSAPNWWFPILPASVCSTLNADLSTLLYLPLIHISSTDGIDYSRSIASGIKVSQNDTVFTISLNPKWHWSNGNPVTANDVLYGWDIINAASQSNAPWLYCGAGIGGLPQDWKSVTAPNSTTVVVTTTKPVNPVWFEHNGIGQLIPIPVSVWKKHNNIDKELTFLNSVGNEPTSPLYSVVDGPYKIGTYVNDEYWTLLANSAYNGHKAQGPAKKLVFEYETSSANVFAGERKGQFDTAGVPDTYYKAAKTELKGYKMELAGYSFCFNYMVPNFSPTSPSGAIFDSLAVRQAMQMGIDQAAIIKDFDLGVAVPTYGPVPSVPKNQYYDPNIPKYTFNIAAGKKLLENHGWKMVNGVMTKGSQKLEFTWLVASGSNTVTHTAELIKADWASEGIVANIKEEPFNQVISAVGQGPQASKWSLAWWGGGWCYEPDYYPTGGGLFLPTSAANYGGYSSKTMDRLINATYGPATPAQAQKYLDAYQVWAAKDLPVLYLPTATGYEVVKPWLHGVNANYNPVTTAEWFNRWTIGR